MVPEKYGSMTGGVPPPPPVDAIVIEFAAFVIVIFDPAVNVAAVAFPDVDPISNCPSDSPFNDNTPEPFEVIIPPVVATSAAGRVNVTSVDCADATCYPV